MFLSLVNFDICNNYLFCIFSLVTPYIVLYITKHYTERNSNKQIKDERERFYKGYELQRNGFEQQLNEKKTETRLAIMPYLVLMKKDVKFSFRESEKGIVDIKLIFMNKGNGTATNVMCKCISDEMHKNTNLVAITYTYDYYVAIPFDWYSDVVMVNELLSIQLMFEPSRVKFETNEMITSDQFDFDVLFRDIQGRN